MSYRGELHVVYIVSYSGELHHLREFYVVYSFLQGGLLPFW